MLDDRSLPARRHAIIEGNWLPLPGTLAAHLGNQRRQGRCIARTLKDLRRLVRRGYRRNGWWWIEILDAPIDTIDATDREWVTTAWDELAA